MDKHLQHSSDYGKILNSKFQKIKIPLVSANDFSNNLKTCFFNSFFGNSSVSLIHTRLNPVKRSENNKTEIRIKFTFLSGSLLKITSSLNSTLCIGTFLGLSSIEFFLANSKSSRSVRVLLVIFWNIKIPLVPANEFQATWKLAFSTVFSRILLFLLQKIFYALEFFFSRRQSKSKWESSTNNQEKSRIIKRTFVLLFLFLRHNNQNKTYGRKGAWS